MIAQSRIAKAILVMVLLAWGRAFPEGAISSLLSGVLSGFLIVSIALGIGESNGV